MFPGLALKVAVCVQYYGYSSYDGIPSYNGFLSFNNAHSVFNNQNTAVCTNFTCVFVCVSQAQHLTFSTLYNVLAHTNHIFMKNHDVNYPRTNQPLTHHPP